MYQVQPSPIDMATLIGCKAWIGGIAGTAQDANIQACITAASLYFVRQCGRGPRNWQTFTQNPFNQSVNYSETYDGISGLKLFLRNMPINSVSSVAIAGTSVPQSLQPPSPGWVIDDQGRALTMRAGGGGASPQSFAYVALWGNGFTAGAVPIGQGFRPWFTGPQQIQISYAAGFIGAPVANALNTVIPAWQASKAYSTGAQVSDGTYLQVALNSGTSGAQAPSWLPYKGVAVTTNDNGILWQNTGQYASPNMILIQGDAAILSDQGVNYFIGGAALTKVNVSPNAGQYFLVAPGQYLFNAADAGAQMLVSYTPAGTPPDVILAVQQLVALNYVRRNWIGLRSQIMKDVGSVVYQMDWDQMIKDTIQNYKRGNFTS